MARRAGTRPCETEASQEIPPYLVLLRVGFALPAALLRRRCALTAPFHPYLSLAARAVCFLWHFPSNRLQPAVPDVIRHTALRSSDFPPVSRRATVRSGCQPIHYSRDAACRVSGSLQFTSAGRGRAPSVAFAHCTSLGARRNVYVSRAKPINNGINPAR